MSVSRRNFVQLAGAGLLLQVPWLRTQTGPGPEIPNAEPPVGLSRVALAHGEDRRRNVHDALLAIDDQVRAGLRHKKYVVIKPNNVSTTNQLAATHADALHGILDYLEPRFRGPVIIAESSAGDTLQGFENFGYNRIAAEQHTQKVSLVD